MTVSLFDAMDRIADLLEAGRGAVLAPLDITRCLHLMQDQSRFLYLTARTAYDHHNYAIAAHLQDEASQTAQRARDALAAAAVYLP